MKTKQSKVTRRITMALSAIMLSEQLAGTGAVLYAHAEDEIKTEYKIEHSVTSSWDGGCNANVTLTNLADRDTQDWSITFSTTDKITNLWGGTITECLEIKTAEEEAEIEEIEEADDKFEDIFESAFKDEFEDDIFADFSDEFEEEIEEDVEEEYIETLDEENEVENIVEVSENATENVTSEEVDGVEPTVVEAETDDEATEASKATEETEEVIVETQEYDFDAPVVEEYEVYYQYTVKALDYNAVIKSGESVTIGYMAEGNSHDIWDEKAEITLKEAEKTASIPVGGTYEYDDYTVEVKIPAYWDGAYNVQLLITNTSDETIHNWAFVMETANTISGLYNAVEVSGNDNEEDNVHLIKNAGHNQDIPAGGTVELGYTAYYEDEVDVPDDFALSQIETEVTTAECEVSLFVSNEWGDGGLAQIIIKNISKLPIEDWMIEFDSALDIKEIWDGVIESHEGNHYFIRNSGYAQNIMPGESWTIGFLFNGEIADIENIQVRQIVLDKTATPRVAKEDPTPYIQYMDTTPSEDTEDIGEVYFKELTSVEDVILNADNEPCVRDQLLLVANDEVSKSEVEELVSQYDFRIVGAIELTGDYQIESIYELNNDELQKAFYAITQSDIVRHASYNFVSYESSDFGSNDTFSTYYPSDDWGKDDWGKEWTTARPAGNNWGIESIDFEGALEAAGIIDNKNVVVGQINLDNYKALPYCRVGVFDKGISLFHPDLDYKRVWNNVESDHGTHVAGIMAATFNNRIGICGTSIKSQLYSFSITNADNGFMKKEGYDYNYKEMSELIYHMFLYKCGFALLIGNNVKVINFSNSCSHDQVAILRSADIPGADGTIALSRFAKRSEELEFFLSRLLDKGYDFLIVTSAGNGQYFDNSSTDDAVAMWKYSKDLERIMGNGFWNYGDDFWENQNSVTVSFYKHYEYDDTSGELKYSYDQAYGLKSSDAQYNSELNYIHNSKVADHIICVGALGYDETTGYYQSPSSERGDRVDILAPGDDIYSCIAHRWSLYGKMSGTSMAAPYVAGVAGLAYSVDPNLDASTLKKYIIDGGVDNIDGYPRLNAANVINSVLKNRKADTNEPPIITDECTIAGVVYIDTGDYYENGNKNYELAVGTTVSVSDKQGNVIAETEVDIEGNYVLVVPAGIYDISFYSDICEEECIYDQEVKDGDIKRVDDMILTLKPQIIFKNLGTLVLTVTENGIPVPEADVQICHMSSRSHKSYADVTNESVDPCGYTMKARTDSYGRLVCHLEAKNDPLSYNGCYVIMVDKDNISGNSDNIGRMVWPNCYFVEGLEAGAEITKEIVLEPYSNYPNNQHIIFQVSEEHEQGNVSGCTVRLYKGWNVTNYSAPTYVTVQNPESVYRWEQIEFDVPLGRYTAEVERLGVKKHMEILVTPNSRIFYAVMGEDDNVVNH